MLFFLPSGPKDLLLLKLRLFTSGSTKEEGGPPFKKFAGINTSRSAGFSEIETNGRELQTAEM